MSAEIIELSDIEALRELAELFAVVWGRPGEPPISSDVLKALAQSGNYITGAYEDRRLIGGLVGWLGGSPVHGLHMHSHILGVVPGTEARGLGFELKQHQRRWCLDRTVKVIEWTTDPLVRRNAYFNLTKLGARAPEYLVDFYGQMRDGINAGEESDRLLIRWVLDSAQAQAAAAGSARERKVEEFMAAAEVVLTVGDHGEPVSRKRRGKASLLLCEVPEDIVAIRRDDPALARNWRLALRAALTDALGNGYELSGATRSGWYVLESGRL